MEAAKDGRPTGCEVRLQRQAFRDYAAQEEILVKAQLILPSLKDCDIIHFDLGGSLQIRP
jgi:hypothetical protein